MSNRFDYVKYDEDAIRLQLAAKELCLSLESLIEGHLRSARPKASALTNLEVVYMWIGKAIRDDQIFRNNQTELQEGRGNE